MIIHFYTMPVIISMHTKSSRDNLSLELLLSLLVCAEWKQCDSSCSLDCENNLTLMLCACSGYTTWQNLASFGNETTQSCYVLIINGVDVINTALADLSSWSSYSISSYHDSYPPISCIRMESVHPDWMSTACISQRNSNKVCYHFGYITSGAILCFIASGRITTFYKYACPLF